MDTDNQMVLLSLLLLAQNRVGDNQVATGHLLDPVGQTLVINARPVDLVLSPDRKYALVKENRGLTVVRTSDWTVAQESPVKGGASMFGLLCSADGKVYFSDAASTVHVGQLSSQGEVAWNADWKLPAPKAKGSSYPCGMAFLPQGLAVCASRSNSLVLFGPDGSVQTSIELDPAPYGVAIAPDGKTAWVTCWGRPPRRRSSGSGGTLVDIDERGVSTGGMVDVVDLVARKVVARLEAGLQPSQILIDKGLAYVANANSDTLGVYRLRDNKRLRTIVVKPDPQLAFGSAPNAMAVSPDGKDLFVACGGNNAVAVLGLGETPQLKGFLPTNWYPGALACAGGKLFVACIKGIGSRNPNKDQAFNVHRYTGSVTQADIPAAADLPKLTEKVQKLAFVPEILSNLERANTLSALPEPVPEHLGYPSSIEHVVYVVKENRTYDQVLGDIGRGESDPKLTIYGQDVSPNHHALANEFVLLDNFYCNGVNSADGHAWVTEGDASSYLERSFGGFTRSYPFGGDDALSSVSSGYLWDAVLGRGKSFRNYGEGDYAGWTTQKSWKEIFDAAQSGQKMEFKQGMALDRLRRYSCRDYPGWNLGIPDQYRANVFIKELADFEKKGSFPNLTIVYLPQDHTSGLTPGQPTPKAMVADNDYALGRVVDALSHSKFWPKMAIFVIEDDAQDGWDHVDGHRSPCLVISPFARRQAVISVFYNQTAVIHTMLQILGVPPLNQMDASSPIMLECFQPTPDLTPYTVKPPLITLDQLNTPKSASLLQRKWMAQSMKLDFSKPDAADEEALNRAQWVAVKDRAPYPERFEGAHGKGLKQRGLKLEKR